jgi:phosphomevalonate kinase
VILDVSWAKFMARMGMSGIAIFLIYQLTMGMQANVATTANLVQQHAEESKRNEDDFDRLLRTLLNVTVQQCVNAASTEAKRDACFQASRDGATPIRTTVR